MVTATDVAALLDIETLPDWMTDAVIDETGDAVTLSCNGSQVTYSQRTGRMTTDTTNWLAEDTADRVAKDMIASIL